MQKLTAFWQKHKRGLLCILLTLVMLFTALCVLWTVILPGRTKSLSMKLNDNYPVLSPQVTTSLHQTFSSNQSIYALSFVFQLPEGQPWGKLHLRLLNADTGEELSQSTGEMQYIISGRYTAMGLDTPVPAGSAERYEVILEPEYTNDFHLYLGYSTQNYLDGQLTVNDRPIDGSIALAASIDRIAGFLPRFYLAMILPLIALAAGLYWLATGRWKGPQHLHKLFLVAAAVLGFVYCFVLPPCAVPDELMHFNQSFSNATRLSTYLDGDDWHLSSIPLQTTFRRPGDINPVVEDRDTTVFTWRTVQEDLFSRNPRPFGSWQEYPDQLQVDNSNLLYLFSSLGVFLGFCLGLGFVPCMILARLANYLFFVGLTTWAIKKAPFGKSIFMAVALLPMTLHLAMSGSRDSPLLAMTFLWTSLCLDAAFGPHERLSRRHLIGLAVLGLILAPAKSVYLPLMGLCLIIPAARLGKRPRAKQAGFLVLCCLVFLFSSARFQVANFLGLNAAVPVAQEVVVTETDPAAEGGEIAPEEAEAALAEEDAPQPQAGPVNPDAICYVPGYILEHPGLTIKLVINSVIENADHYIKSLVGGNLSYYTIDIAWGWVLLCYALLLFSTLGTAHELTMAPWGRFWALIAGLACCALAVLGCISWTPTHFDTIYGLQGRYFLPVLPALLLALRPKHGLLWEHDVSSNLATGFAVVNAGFLLNTMLIIIAR